MKIYKVILAVLVIFGAGVVTGGLVTGARSRDLTRAQNPAPVGPPGSGAWKQPRMEFVQKVRTQLNLSTNQSSQVDRIMQESQERMARLWEPIAPQAREETRTVREQIQAILTPEQKSKFEEICKPKRQRNEKKGPGEKQKVCSRECEL